MSKFCDFKGRTWEIPHWDPYIIAEVREGCGVSLYELPQKLEEVNALFTNTPLFANVLWLLVKDQANGIDEREFARGLIGGTVLQDAAEAFWAEVLFFSPPELAKLLEKGMQQAKALQGDTLKKAEQQITTNLRQLFGSSQDAPALTRKGRRSAG